MPNRPQQRSRGQGTRRMPWPVQMQSRIPLHSLGGQESNHQIKFQRFLFMADTRFKDDTQLN